MTSDRRTLLDSVVDRLDEQRVPYALIGAAALAIHGISRSTLDVDLLVTDVATLEPDFWTALPPHVTTDFRRGDALDPLAGVIRMRADGERDVDVVVGRATWQADAIGRAIPTSRAGRSMPVVQPADLILLKLYAGGSQDRWDIEQLLALSDRDAMCGEVDRTIARLPRVAQKLWTLLRPAS